MIRSREKCVKTDDTTNPKSSGLVRIGRVVYGGVLEGPHFSIGANKVVKLIQLEALNNKSRQFSGKVGAPSCSDRTGEGVDFPSACGNGFCRS
jgi:hypothetical protein